MPAEAGAAAEIAAGPFAEARRWRPGDRPPHVHAFLPEAALGGPRLWARGGNVGAGRAIGEVRRGGERALAEADLAPGQAPRARRSGTGARGSGKAGGGGARSPRPDRSNLRAPTVVAELGGRRRAPWRALGTALAGRDPIFGAWHA
jgi:hypothetical protein